MWHAAVVRAYSKKSVPLAAQVKGGDLVIMLNAALWMRDLLLVEPMSVHSYVEEPSKVPSCLDLTQAVVPGAAAAATSKVYSGQDDGQVVWPTPTPAVWGNIQTIANRVLITVEWLVAHLQEKPEWSKREATLYAVLIQICHQLLVGHILDHQLNMMRILLVGAIPLLSVFFDMKTLTKPKSHKAQHICIDLEELVSLFLKRMATDQDFLAKELDYTDESWVVAIVEWIAHGFGKPPLYICDRTLMH